MRVLTVLACLLAALLAPATAAAKGPSAPKQFFGILGDGPLFFDERIELDDELRLMRRSGVRSLRSAVYWHTVQPYASFADVPAGFESFFTDEGGVPTNWAAVDRLVALTARRKLRLLPVVLRAPEWAREDPELDNSRPSADGRRAYAAFLGAMVRRYGTKGAFWDANPDLRRLPVRQWQVWNEPAGERDWAQQPGLPEYMKLLRASARAVRRADRRAQVVLAGLVGRSWEQLAEVYERGGRRHFDAVAIHPFTEKVRNVLAILDEARAVMDRSGDRRKPMLVTELSWPSAKGRTDRTYGFEQTEKGQAKRLRAAVKRIAARRKRLRVPAVYWSSWLSYDRDPTYSFDYSGLRRIEEDGSVTAKPAFRAFKRVVRDLTR